MTLRSSGLGILDVLFTFELFVVLTDDCLYRFTVVFGSINGIEIISG
jgi:hypothetical protein